MNPLWEFRCRMIDACLRSLQQIEQYKRSWELQRKALIALLPFDPQFLDPFDTPEQRAIRLRAMGDLCRMSFLRIPTPDEFREIIRAAESLRVSLQPVARNVNFFVQPVLGTPMQVEQQQQQQQQQQQEQEQEQQQQQQQQANQVTGQGNGVQDLSANRIQRSTPELNISDSLPSTNSSPPEGQASKPREQEQQQQQQQQEQQQREQEQQQQELQMNAQLLDAAQLLDLAFRPQPVSQRGIAMNVSDQPVINHEQQNASQPQQNGAQNVADPSELIRRITEEMTREPSMPYTYLLQQIGEVVARSMQESMPFPGPSTSHTNNPYAGDNYSVITNFSSDLISTNGDAARQSVIQQQPPQPQPPQQVIQQPMPSTSATIHDTSITRPRSIGGQYSCRTCSKVYTQASALKMHLRTHTLPCRCEHCGKSFSRKWLLKGHERTHTGERPYSCTQCNRAFADRSNLRAHMQTHQRDKRYICQRCPRSFSRMGLLNKHMMQCKGGAGRMHPANQPSTRDENANGSSDNQAIE